MWLIQGKSFADLKLTNLRRSRVSQAHDTVSFSQPGDFDSAPLFNYGDILTISYQDDRSKQTTPWFLGRVIQIPRAGAGNEEEMRYELAGPWWFLDNLVYQQIWATAPRLSPAELDPDEVKIGEKTITDPETGKETKYDLIGQYKSRIIIGQKQDGSRMKSDEIIKDVINYAIAAGAPIKLGNVAPALEIPFDEQQDVTCAEVIRRVLRWSPDAVTWFDYSTVPYPTFHCQPRSALPPISLNITHASHPKSQISNLQIIPRDDLIVPSVVLKFEQTNSINGIEYESIITDKFPLESTGREFGALTATLQLAGAQANYVTQKIVSVEIGESETTFWEEHDQVFNVGEKQISNVIPGTTSPPLATSLYKYELKEGQIQEWMTECHAEPVTYTAQVRTVTKDDAGEIVKEEIRTVSCTIITTDAKSGTYTKLAGLVTGEPIPTGLAAALYNSLNPLQYAGSVTLSERECGADSKVGAALRTATGFVLNFIGGPSEWQSMRAMIQQVDDDVDAGRTTITFGPAEQLSPQDLIERLRANRGRGVAYNFLKRKTGESASPDNVVALGGPTPIVNTAGAAGQSELIVVSKTNKKITLDPSQITAPGAMEIKTVSVNAIVNGANKSVNILASEEFSFLPNPPGGNCVLIAQGNQLTWVPLAPFTCAK